MIQLTVRPDCMTTQHHKELRQPVRHSHPKGTPDRRIGRTCPCGQMTAGADVLGRWRSTWVVVGRRAVGSQTGQFLGTVLVRVGLGETGLQVTNDCAELA